MNLRLVAKLLGIVSLLIGATMIFSLPWAIPSLGTRDAAGITVTGEFEIRGFCALSRSVVFCFLIGGGLWLWGRKSQGQMFRKEAMAVVGLSWLMATFLGALPYWLSETQQGPSIRFPESTQRSLPEESTQEPLPESNQQTPESKQPPAPAAAQQPWVVVRGLLGVRGWRPLEQLKKNEATLVRQLLAHGSRGLPAEEINKIDPSGVALLDQLAQRDQWKRLLLVPDDNGPSDRWQNYRIAHLRMSMVDSMFESQSGFSTTGSTVIADLEDPFVVPHCILFWRSSTHFLGGLGIIVLFVVLLGQGSKNKALMLAEMPGPSQDSSMARIQHVAWRFAGIYVALIVVLTILLWLFGLTWFDAICHAFGTMATGGFSTYNSSVGFFNSARIDYTIVLFMILAGSNFTLLYLLIVKRQLGKLFRDTEWRVYVVIILLATFAIMIVGNLHDNFADLPGDETSLPAAEASLPAVDADMPIGTMWLRSLQYGLFQAVSIVTTTGFTTNNFDAWNNFSRGLLFVLMFIGGCAGSTGGGLKVIRHILFVKILRLEIEHVFHPKVVRPLRMGGEPVTHQNLRHNILVYFAFILAIFVGSWLFLIATEPDATWNGRVENKLIDSASAVAAMLNNIGPGLGTVGPTKNYAHFTWHSKLLFTWLMMLGRVEVFVILCLFVPRFWRAA